MSTTFSKIRLIESYVQLDYTIQRNNCMMNVRLKKKKRKRTYIFTLHRNRDLAIAHVTFIIFQNSVFFLQLSRDLFYIFFRIKPFNWSPERYIDETSIKNDLLVSHRKSSSISWLLCIRKYRYKTYSS